MNGISNNDDGVECPLCMEPLEVDDLNFYPCTCGYQICRFCWHRIRTDENELCPACRKEYPENPADFTPLTQEEMIAFKSQKRQRDQQRKQKITENRKHLANVRVVQKNLVFVVGLPPRLADADILKKHEYFGKYGKIHKVVINPSTTYAGVQGPSASAYVTYVNNSDALRAIQSVNNIMIDGRLIKTSLGTTKYCSHFMKNQQCPKGDCMYLHELGDPEASFTKEEMHQGKHQEYEKRLHDMLIASSGPSSNASIGGNTTNSCPATSGNVSILPTSNTNKLNDGIKINTIGGVASFSSSLTSSSASSSSSSSATTNCVTITAGGSRHKDAWPSLSVSPVNNKDSSNKIIKNRKERLRSEKIKNENNIKNKNKNQTSNINGSCSSLHTSNKEIKSTAVTTQSEANNSSDDGGANHSSNNKNKIEKLREKSVPNLQQTNENCVISADEEVTLIEDTEDRKSNNATKSNHQNIELIDNSEIVLKSRHPDQRSLSSSSNMSSSSSSSIVTIDSTNASSENTSGKSSPRTSYSESISKEKKSNDIIDEYACSSGVSLLDSKPFRISDASNNEISVGLISSKGNEDCIARTEINDNNQPQIFTNASDDMTMGDLTNLHCSNINAADAISKLSLFDDNNSFFTSTPSLQQTILSKKSGSEIRTNQMNCATTSHLPDLLNGIDGYPNCTPSSNEWEEALRNVRMRNKLVLEDQVQQHQLYQQQHQNHQQYPLQEFNLMLGMQKRINPLNTGLSQVSESNDLGNVSRLPQANIVQQQLLQQHQQQQQNAPQATDHLMNANVFGANMTKFFDFHKNQQQISQHMFFNSHPSENSNDVATDAFCMPSLENNRVNSQYMDQTIGFSTPQQMQKQRLHGKCDSMGTQQLAQNQIPQHTQRRSPQTLQLLKNASVDDDLGFDPFFETQKALAELMENELIQQQNPTNIANTNNVSTQPPKNITHQQQQQQQLTQQQILDNMQRARMPPPGFNHVNSSYGYGNARSQNNSKILPFVGMPGISGSNCQLSQQPLQFPNTWKTHSGSLLQQNLTADPQLQQINQNHIKGYNNDWTAMDPAILSLRQFSVFPQQQHSPNLQHGGQQDIFLQHLNQQQQQSNGQGFPSHAQIHGGNNLSNGLLSTQQGGTQAHVNANVQGMLEFLKTRQFV